jgi:hypothetical protein
MEEDSDAEELFPGHHDSRPADPCAATHGSGKFRFRHHPQGFEFTKDDFTRSFFPVFDELADYLSEWHLLGPLTPQEKRSADPAEGPFTLVAGRSGVRVENSSGEVVAIVPRDIVDKVEVVPPPFLTDGEDKASGSDNNFSRSDYETTVHGSLDVTSRYFFPNHPRGYEFSTADDVTVAYAPVYDKLADFLTRRYFEDNSLSREENFQLHPSKGPFMVVAGGDGQFQVHNARGVSVAVIPGDISGQIKVGRTSTKQKPPRRSRSSSRPRSTPNPDPSHLDA